jgi:hypothetical protein
MLREFSGLLVSMARGKTRKQRGGRVVIYNNNSTNNKPITPSLTKMLNKQEKVSFEPKSALMYARAPSKSLPSLRRQQGIRELTLTNNQGVIPIKHVNMVPQPLFATKISNNKRHAPQKATKKLNNKQRSAPITKWEPQGEWKRPISPLKQLPRQINFIGETKYVNLFGRQPIVPSEEAGIEEITIGNNTMRAGYRNTRRQNRRGLGSGFKVSWTRHACRRMPKTAKDKAAYKKWLAGRSIGFTERSHLKALGVIPRANGTCKVSPKYR